MRRLDAWHWWTTPKSSTDSDTTDEVGEVIEDFSVKRISLDDPWEREQLLHFLMRHDLAYEEDIESAFGVFGDGDILLACGCASGALLKCFAVEETLRGQNILGCITSALIQERFSKGRYDLMAVTRTKNEVLFRGCGFYTVAKTDSIVMMENRPNGVEIFTEKVAEPVGNGQTVGAIVMNCNPFTLGHRGLIEYAAGKCDILYIFVVEEDRSEFPTEVRFRLVREGTKDLPQVRCCLGGPYMISAATFPTYFLKKDEDAAMLQGELDITIFAQRIAPLLHITKRFAGEEPFDPITRRYNATMEKLLPKYGIEFCKIPRIVKQGKPISASTVRHLLKKRNGIEMAKELLPDVTNCYLEETARREDHEYRNSI